MDGPRLKRIACVSVLILLLTLLNGQALYETVSTLGLGDFASYWSAFQLFADGRNPYDPVALFEAQRSIGLERDANFMVFPAPWVFVVLSPVLVLPLEWAVPVWLGLNFLLLALSAVLSWRLFREEAPLPSPAVSLAFAAFAVPVWKTFETGQLAMVLCAALVGAFTLIRKGRDFAAGALLIVSTLKPHLFVLLAIAFVVWLVTSRRWRIAAGFACALSGAIAFASLVSPRIFEEWIAFSSGWAASSSGPLVWKTGSPATLVREVIEAWLGYAPAWPMTVLTAAAALGCAAWLIRRRGIVTWEKDFPRLIALSLFTAPYLWLSDLALLIPLQIAIARESLYIRPSNRAAIVSLAALQIYAVLAYELLPETGIAPYPLLMLAIWEWIGSGGNTETAAPLHEEL